MGTISGLPYPEGTDLVVNGDNAIKALAQAVAQNLTQNATPSNVPLGSGWVTAAPFVLRLWNVNGWIMLNGRAQRSTGSATLIGTLAASWRPTSDLIIPALAYTGTTAGALNGTVNVTTADGQINFVATSAAPPAALYVSVFAMWPKS